VTTKEQRVSGATPLRIPADGLAAQSEIDMEFLVSPDDTSDVSVELSNAAGETYRIGFDQATRRFYSDRTALPKGFSDKFATGVHWAPRIATDSVVRMHVYVDRASVELFADGGATAITDILFPTQDFSSMRLVVKGDAVRLRYANVSALKSIWQ
jgi:fructan beta-fructosidase